MTRRVQVVVLIVLIMPLFLLSLGCSQGREVGPWVDLTYPFDDQTVYWPNNQPFAWQKTAWGRTAAGYWYASGTFSTAEHGGTHMDAPIHFAEGRAAVDEIPPQQLAGPALVVDVTALAAESADYEVTRDDLLDWEARNGRIPNGGIVLIRSGWARYWPNREAYFGTSTPDDARTLHFPGLSPTAAKFLAQERRVHGVGIDTASIDPGRSADFPVHRILNDANMYILENVANLDRLPTRGAILYAFPIKIRGGTGGPVRIMATLP